MLKVYKQEMRIPSAQTDLSGQWRPSAILETMQDMAGAHAELLGVGRSMLIQHNTVWVLTRVEVEMDRYPASGELISIETFPMPCRRVFFPRYFIFRDAAGNEIGRAGSLWVLLDFTTRRMSPGREIAALMPDNSDLIAPLGLPGPVTEVSGVIEEETILPRYTDIDVNQHVNNTKYLDWCCNALGIEAMKESCLSHIVINYDAEVLPGQEVRAQLRRLGDDFSYCGFVDGTRHFDVGGTMRRRA